MRVLIVDDEPAIRRFLDEVLRGAGYQTVLAGDGEDAFEIPGPFDLLLTDLMMPRMAGDVLALKMFKRDPKLKVLYLTGQSDRLFKKKVTLWYSEAFLDKPVTAEALLDAIDALLRGGLVGSR